MDKTGHQAVLAQMERELAELLDASAGATGHEITMYRSLLWDAKAHAKAAAAQLGRVPEKGGPTVRSTE